MLVILQVKKKMLRKISFSTACMNRLHHLRRTLPQNIQDNSGYPNVEFVILDYNSSDGLESWIKEEMDAHLKTGRVVYYRTEEPNLFHRSHSRNLSFKLASGDIFCNVDADNYTGQGFAAYIDHMYEMDEQIFLTCIDFHKSKRHYHPLPDAYGRICFTRDAFYKIKGYNERMSTHGFQDYDFANRLELSGNRRVFIENLDFLTAITHDNNERFGHEFINNQLFQILYKPLSPSSSEIIFFYNNGTFESGILIDNSIAEAENFMMAFARIPSRYQYTLASDKWEAGNWIKSGTFIFTLCGANQESRIITTEESDNSAKISDHFKLLGGEETIKQLKIFNTQFTNRTEMHKNWDLAITIPNKGVYGKGIVYKNHNILQPIEVI